MHLPSHEVRRAAGVLVGAVILVGVSAYILYWSSVGTKQIYPGNEIPTASQIPSLTIEQNNITDTIPSPTPSSVLYTIMYNTFTGLGISFEYEAGLDAPITAQVVGNTIYVGDAPEPDKDPDSQIIRVYSKPPSESLKTAITKQLLSNYNPNDCPITLYFGSQGYQSAVMNYASDNIPSNAIGGALDPSKCPGDYIPFDNQRGFLMNSHHPNIFLFLDLGQMGTISPDTIKFL